MCGTGYACKGTAGARTCQPALCGDGIDNDGDGKTDYPADPGCDSLGDDTEANPATPPVCADGMDNDTDTLVDWPNDFGCTAASGTSEVFCATETDPATLITTSDHERHDRRQANNFTKHLVRVDHERSRCRVRAATAGAGAGLLVLDTNTSPFDTIVTMRDPQCAAEIGCDDDSGDPGTQSKLTMTNVAPGNYAVLVDGYSGSSGTFILTIKVHWSRPMTPCSSPLFTGGVAALLDCPSGTTCTRAPTPTCRRSGRADSTAPRAFRARRAVARTFITRSSASSPWS